MGFVVWLLFESRDAAGSGLCSDAGLKGEKGGLLALSTLFPGWNGTLLNSVYASKNSGDSASTGSHELCQ